MNYSGIEWTKKTGITKTDLDIMDGGIKAAHEEISKINASVIALKNSNIQRGYYVFAQGTPVDSSSKITVAKITTPSAFSGSVTIVATVNTSRPDYYRVSTSRIGGSNDSFNIYFHASSAAITDNKLKYEVGVHWIILDETIYT